jgi:hypothetical protein
VPKFRRSERQQRLDDRYGSMLSKKAVRNQLLGFFACSCPGMTQGERLARIAMVLTQSTRTPDLLAGRVDGVPLSLGSARWQQDETHRVRQRDLGAACVRNRDGS